MASLQSILRRRPEVDEAEFELVRTKTLSRLTALSNGELGTPEEPAEENDTTGEADPGEAPSALAMPAPAEAEGVVAEPDPEMDEPSAHVAIEIEPADAAPEDESGSDTAAGYDASVESHVAETRPRLVGVMSEPTEPTTSWDHVAWSAGDAGASSNGSHAPVEETAPAITSASLVLGPRGLSSGLWDAASTAAVAAADAIADEPPVIKVARPAPRTGAKSKKASAGPTAVVASCPYCALLLEPPPEASRRCTRCRQRIIVKRVDGRAVYLTEASLLVFSAQRRRNAHLGRWTRDRERWLKGAAAVGAAEARVDRLTRAPLTEDSVRAAQALYMTTVDKSYRSARREHRWEDASRIKRDQAMLLFRFAGSPTPPPEDIVDLHREGAAAALRGIGEMAKDAQLVNATCCGICRADAGRAFRINHELRVPRLPHAGCPKGLCRCDWDLAIRDRDMVRRYLKRRRPDPVLASDESSASVESTGDDAAVEDARA